MENDTFKDESKFETKLSNDETKSSFHIINEKSFVKFTGRNII